MKVMENEIKKDIKVKTKYCGDIAVQTKHKNKTKYNKIR